MGASVGVLDVAKKKTGASPRRYGTLIRVSDELAEALRHAVSIERISMAQFGDQYLLPVVRKRYREAVLREARRMEGGER